MKNWKFLLLLSIGSLSLICISCEKEEEIEFPITLYGSEVVKVSNISMFTNKEDIYDTDKILQFAYSSNVVLPGIPDNMDIKNSLTPICFCSEDSVRFKDDPFVNDVEKNGKQCLYSSRPGFLFEGDVNSICFRMMKYPMKYDPPLSIPKGRYWTKEIRVAYGSYQDIELCYLLYKISEYTDYSYSLKGGKAFNEFNPEVISTLGVRDTLAIQEYRIRFKK